jgi:hypothetical protein
MRSPWRALLQDIKLMPQHQDLGFQLLSRLEAVAQRADEEEGNCDHQPQSCPDSVAHVTPADGVFGSDNLVRDTGDLRIGSISAAPFELIES